MLVLAALGSHVAATEVNHGKAHSTSAHFQQLYSKSNCDPLYATSVAVSPSHACSVVGVER
jgi:hypothetical protein